MAVPNKDQVLRFTLDGVSVQAMPDESILEVAERQGIPIPHLCYKQGLRADGNCRACMVEIRGEQALAASCCRQVREGMEVHTDSERARRCQQGVLELLSSDMPETPYTLDSELAYWSRKLDVDGRRYPQRRQVASDLSHSAITVNLDACIQCTRCLRACREEQVNDVIGYAFRGAKSAIVFDLDDALGDSSCVACGECVQACPTGALMPAGGVGLQAPDRKVDSICPYCGVGCLLTYNIKNDRILTVEGRNGPANQSRLCVKGRYGFDYVSHPQRLTLPLIRRPDVEKSVACEFDPSDPLSLYREASWEEALDLAAEKLCFIRDTFGASALAGLGSAKGSNEEAYLFQKLVRCGFGTNNVDHCTRLCHASSVAALMEGLGNAAVSNPVSDVAEADLLFVIGANATANHPVAATFMKNAVKAGKTLILLDPRRTDLARHARYFLQFNPDTDVALLNAMLHCIIEEDLLDREFVKLRTENFAALKAQVAGFSPEAMAPVCGIKAEIIRAVARCFANSRAAMIFWGMGISQHVHGTDNARCLIALSMITGQIGRPGTGLHPLRGQNNVQGASDAGLIPMVFPDYQRVDNEQAQEKFQQHWGLDLDARPGLTVVEIMHAAVEEKIKGMYIMGENPAMSDPNLNFSRQALANLDFLVVQDLFLTETAYFADVIFPASAFPEKEGTFTNTDRRVQLGRKALPLPGAARADLDIIQDLARRLGLNWQYESTQAVFDEMRSVMPSIAGITWQRLQAEHSVTYPCEKEGDAGEPVVFIDNFPTLNGRAKLVPAGLITADEKPDPSYPLVLITGRQLEHWHTGAMTRRSRALHAIESSPYVEMNPQTVAKMGLQAGDEVRIQSRRGQLKARIRIDAGLRPEDVFMPFCFHEAAANLLTNEAMDPFGKIPEFKYCAVRIAPTVERIHG